MERQLIAKYRGETLKTDRIVRVSLEPRLIEAFRVALGLR